ncbi:MAG: hypothetical protein KDJ30_15695 [Rhodoblastus sp.]|nr:hypothetical protein [Rhodoblastus sp.]
MATKTNELDDVDDGARAPRGLRVALVLAALALAAGCGVLWMRYGAQVFIDAALFAWRSCF